MPGDAALSGGDATILVLGGIRGGKSHYAESLLAAAAQVTYLATAESSSQAHDPDWARRLAQHRARRPEHWHTEELAREPERLAELIAAGQPDQALIVDDIGGWVLSVLGRQLDEAAVHAALEPLVAAVRRTCATVVLVSPEVGLSVVPATRAGRIFADALGVANRLLAEVCAGVVLVVAGQPSWLKREGRLPTDLATPDSRTATPGLGSAPLESPATAAAGGSPDAPAIEPGMPMARPEEHLGEQAAARLYRRGVSLTGLGSLGRAVSFAAAVQATATPRPWRTVRVLCLYGRHGGGAAAGDANGRLDGGGEEVLIRLADAAGATIQVIDTGPDGPPAAMEEADVLTADAVQTALDRGRALADAAADEGVELLVLAARGVGQQAAAAAVLACLTGTEPAALLARVVDHDGQVDDAAWMRRCVAVRDAVHRANQRVGSGELLAAIGGADLAVGTGLLLGAALRHTPVLLDGPVGIAAAILAREFTPNVLAWCLLTDAGGHPTVRTGSAMLGMRPLTELRLGLPEGGACLALIPLIQTGLGLAGVADQPDQPDPQPATPDG